MADSTVHALDLAAVILAVASFVVAWAALRHTARPKIKVNLVGVNTRKPSLWGFSGGHYHCNEELTLRFRIALRTMSVRSMAADILIDVNTRKPIELRSLRMGIPLQPCAVSVVPGKGGSQQGNICGVAVFKWHPVPYEDFEVDLFVSPVPGKYLLWTTCYAYRIQDGAGIQRFVVTVKKKGFSIRKRSWLLTKLLRARLILAWRWPLIPRSPSLMSEWQEVDEWCRWETPDASRQKY